MTSNSIVLSSQRPLYVALKTAVKVVSYATSYTVPTILVPSIRVPVGKLPLISSIVGVTPFAIGKLILTTLLSIKLVSFVPVATFHNAL